MAENRFIVAATMRGQKIHLQQLCDGKNTFALARTFFHEHLIGSVALCGLRTNEKTEAASRRRLGGGVAGGAHHNDARWKVILHIGVSCESTPLPPSYLGGKWRLTACLAPPGACDWLQVVARGSHVQGRRLHCPLRASRLCQPTHSGAVVCNRVRLSEGSRVFGLRDPGSSIGPFPILRLGFSYCRDLFIETPWF